MPELDLDAIKARTDAATPGPWGWYGNTDVQQMYLATKRYGRMYVMGFRRWGLQGAQPTFCVDRTWKPDPQSGDDFGHAGTIAPAHELASRIVRYEVAPNAASRRDSRVYRADLIGIKNPDAEFIAHARQDVDDLLAEVERLRKDAEEREAMDPIRTAIAQWQDGEIAPHDALTAIQEHIGGAA